jgi:hypothetical protein
VVEEEYQLVLKEVLDVFVVNNCPRSTGEALDSWRFFSLDGASVEELIAGRTAQAHEGFFFFSLLLILKNINIYGGTWRNLGRKGPTHTEHQVTRNEKSSFRATFDCELEARISQRIHATWYRKRLS